MSALILMPLNIVLFSLIGGGYVIRHHLKPASTLASVGAWISKFLGCVVLVVLCAVPEFVLLAIGIFGTVTIRRAYQMIVWARQTALERHNISQVRLLGGAAGMLIVFSGLILVTFAFIVPWHARYQDDLTLLRFLKYQLNYAHTHLHQNGHPYFDHINPTNEDSWRLIRSHWAAHPKSEFRVNYGKDDESFVIWSVPTALPPFPLGLLDRMPSLRADQSGTIRMILVHRNGEICPADAAIVHVVDDKAASTFNLQVREPWSDYEAALNRRRNWAGGRLVW